MVIRIFFIFYLSITPLFASCKNDSNLLNNKIENIKVEFNKEKKFISKVSKYYLSYHNRKNSKKINKKKDIREK